VEVKEAKESEGKEERGKEGRRKRGREGAKDGLLYLEM